MNAPESITAEAPPTATERSETVIESPTVPVEQPAIFEPAKQYAVDFGGVGKILPVRRCKVTASLIEKCRPGIVQWKDHHVRYYVAEGAIGGLLAPYIVSKKLR